MPKIYNIKEPLDLDRLHLAKPVNKNGAHFIKTLDVDDPIYFLAPKCFTKQGFVNHSKKIFCDFVFSNEDSDFLSWLESLEEKTRNGIYENRDKWFETPLDEHDIESSMTPPYKPYKSGKYFIVRANVPTALGKINIKVYNENEEETEPESVKENTRVLAVFEFQGIRCGVRSFQFDIELKQLLIVEPEKLFEKCVISKPATQTDPKQTKDSTEHLDNNPSVHSGLIRVIDEKTDTSGDAAVFMQSSVTPSSERKSREKDPDASEFATQSPISAGESIVLGKPEDLPLSSVSPVVDTFFEQSPSELLTESNSSTNDFLGVNQEGVDVTNSTLSFSNTNLAENERDIVNQESNPSSMSPELDQQTNIAIIEDLPFDEDAPVDEPPIRLKSRNDVYYKLYKETRQRAREAKREALANYLEAKRIKTTYLLNDVSDSESDSDVE